MEPELPKENFWSDAPEEFRLLWRTAMVKTWLGVGCDIEQLISFENMIEQWSDRHLLEQKEDTVNTLVASLNDEKDKELEQLKSLAFLFLMGDEIRGRQDALKNELQP
mgnify:CR=1 FL=1|jgi:hypothetical protein